MNAHTTANAITVIREVSFEDIRRAIDQVATIRARNLRMAYYGMLLYRPDPKTPMTDEVRAQLFAKLDEQLVVIRSITDILHGRAHLPETSRLISNWFAGIAATRPKDLQMFSALVAATERVAKAAKANSVGQQTALAAHIDLVRGDAFQRITGLCDAFWDDLARQQAEQLVTAQEASKALGGCLNRLERIGQHVRLVSLNASVEAARAGTAGKGLMVIAHEFKSLAEEIQNLSQQARTKTVSLS